MRTTDQKAAVITGASRSIGAALVDAYRSLGYAVVATSRGIAPPTGTAPRSCGRSPRSITEHIGTARPGEGTAGGR
ncbi:hypothetical protein ACNFRX_31695, partial [Streptomyces griseoaurantiacus]